MEARPTEQTFYQRTKAARKIMVVDFGFLGDSIHLIPSLWEIKRNYPEAELHTLSAAVGAEVLRMAPCVDRAWAYPLGAPNPPWWRYLGIQRELRAEKFDLAFNFSGADRTLFVTSYLGARWILHHEAGRKHFWNHWLGGDWVPRRERIVPVYEQRRQVLAAAGVELHLPRFELHVPYEDREWADVTVDEDSIHLSISASAAEKEWPLENWIQLCRMLRAKKPQIPLIATAAPNAREQSRLQDLSTALKGELAKSFTALPIPRLAALLQVCQLHIGADSGVLHLATALGVPTVSVFREYDGLAEWMPRGEKNRSLVTRCRCLDDGRVDCAAAGKSACLGGISAQQVCEAACQLLR